MGQSPHFNSNVELGCMGVQNAKMFALKTLNRVPVPGKGKGREAASITLTGIAHSRCTLTSKEVRSVSFTEPLTPLKRAISGRLEQGERV